MLGCIGLMRAEPACGVKSSKLQRYDWFTSNAPLMAPSCARIGYMGVSGFKKDQRCVDISAYYLHTFLAMASFFDEQYPENGWNDFINSNYATGCEDPTLFSSLDYFVSHGTSLEFKPRLTTFFQDLSAGNSHADRISTPAYIDHANLQDSLGGQNSSLRTGETRLEYTEIKALYGENTVVSTLLMAV